jgi:hypothetical protein
MEKPNIHYNETHHAKISPLIDELFLASNDQEQSTLEKGKFFHIEVNDYANVEVQDAGKGIDMQFEVHISIVKLERPVGNTYLTVQFAIE